VTVKGLPDPNITYYQNLDLEGATDTPMSGGRKTSASGDNFCLQGAKILLASHFDYEYMLGHKIVFVCVAKGTPQPQITWFKDGIELYAHSYLHVSTMFIPSCHLILVEVHDLLCSMRTGTQE
jgi:hypothetical protein